MEWYFIVLIVIGSLLVLFGIYLLLGAFIIHAFLSKKSIRKIFKHNASMPNNPFYNQVDLDWFHDENIFRIVSIKSFDKKKLNAHYAINPKDSHKYIIYVHGWCGSPDEETKVLREIYEKLDYNLVCIEQRAQWDNNIKLCTMGIREARDLLSWIDYVIKRDEKAEIVLHGMSMGAGTVALINQYQLPPQVKCLITDAGFTSIYDTFLDSSQMMLGNFLASVFIFSAYIDLKLFHRLDIKKDSPVNALKNCHLPILFIHGDKDQKVPYASMEKLVEALPRDTYREAITFPGTMHGLCAVDDYPRFYKVLTDFITKQNNDSWIS